ncbi:MAG: hypothetical protein LBG83_07560 [Oscillospiraceae bacterium]|jgi:hypothetical protein|nr:hypothetical protein [Oscillospiraceae bacterium]
MLKRKMKGCVAAAMAALLLLAAAPWAAAAPAEGFALRAPLDVLLERLGRSKSVELLELAEGEHLLTLTKLSGEDGERWVRAGVTKNDYFYGACVLGTFEELEGQETLLVRVQFGAGETRLTFFTAPDYKQRAAISLPMPLLGTATLSMFAAENGAVTEPYAEPETTTAATAASAGQKKPHAQPGPGPYLLVFGLLALILLALALGNLYHRRFRAKRQTLAPQGEAAKPEQQAIEPMDELREPPQPQEQDTKPFAPVGLKVVAEQDTLVRRIIMQTQPEPPPERPGEEEAMRAYFLGCAPKPGWLRFLSVGLRNRDALLLGSGARPLFAPNPRGQMFSLEEDSGNLYLHADYFAPPSFVLQSTLRSVCLDQFFRCVDETGEAIVFDDCVNRAIVDIAPARTARTEAGFIVTEPGELVVGRN